MYTSFLKHYLKLLVINYVLWEKLISGFLRHLPDPSLVSKNPPPHLLPCESNLSVFQEQSEHSFKEAMKLEAVNLLSPENIHVATVTRVKGQYIWLSLEGEIS